MRISIAMATYNGAKYLQDQFDSFLYQTRQPDELVVCDDGSTDGTLAILETFREQAPFSVHICRNETTLGYTKNFEKAMSLCTGEIIFLSDQDDVWFCNKIEVMAATLATRQDIFVLQADMVLAHEDMTPTAHTQLGNILALGHKSNMFVHGCGTAFRRSFLNLALPVPGKAIGHDHWIHFLARALEVRMLFHSSLQYYRRHGDNLSKTSFASRPTRVTGFNALRDSLLRDVTCDWRNELETLKEARSRLAESTNALRNLSLSDRQGAAISLLDRCIEGISHRIALLTAPRIQRLPRVVALWMSGRYRDFAGWKSAVMDMLRP